MKKKKKMVKTKKLKNKTISETELLQVIDIISKKLAYKFKFGYHEIDDMKQQITVFALEGLKNYDYKRPLENFLWTHVRNRLFNYKRDNYQRPNKPCLTCPLYDPHKLKSNSECEKYNNKEDCKLYLNWTKRNCTKKNLMCFTNIESINNNFDNDFFIENKNQTINMIDNEMLQNIESKISDEYREIYLKLKSGVKVSKNNKNKLIQHIKKLLNNHE